MLCRSLKDEKRALCLGYTKIGRSKRLSPVRRRHEPRRTLRVQLSMSCPTLVPETRPKICVAVRHLSPPRTRLPNAHQFSASPFLANCANLLRATNVTAMSTRSYSKPCSCGCPCPFPCGPCGCPGGCSCLPPPCNTPPRCIQYMTGYYYYPYGTWFCGPYHVTGTCTPIGPCGPGGPCGPCKCGPPCGPCCICPATACTMPIMGTPGPSPAPQPMRSGVMPGNQIKYPLSQESTRQASKSGISRFFPFNSAAVGPQQPPMDPKRHLPTATVLSSFVCPYSTQAQMESFEDSFIPHVDRPKSASYTASPSQGFATNNKSFTDTSIQTKFPEYDPKYKSPFHYTRSKQCPPLEKPRTILTQEQRDRPRFKAGAFDYASIPNYRNPYPRPNINVEFRAYES